MKTKLEPCGYCGSSQDPDDICKSCWDAMQNPDEPKHKSVCYEYWERGLECQCMPAEVKRALRAGARPEDIM